jgi:demethylmenaquinone methyltransferase/2-methoxy-6-polyprenyl-1,4-benzoquinol methylase
MSSLALMRWLESAPQRYDAGMRWLTLGRVSELHDALADAAARAPGAAVLEIGCGTGAVTARLVARGAIVTALDQSPEMLEQARTRLTAECDGRVTWLEQSEMSAPERGFVLREASRRLRPGGVLAVADEVRPRRGWQRVLHTLLRGPQAALAWLLAGSTSKPLRDLDAELRAAGFAVRDERRWLADSLAVFIAECAP